MDPISTQQPIPVRDLLPALLLMTFLLLAVYLVQFDNESNDLGWQSRLRWIRAPGSDVFAVLGTVWHREDDGSFVPTEQDIEFKIVQTLRL